MQEKSLAVNVFDEGNSSSQQTSEQQEKTQPAQNGSNSQLKTGDGQPFTKQVTDTNGGPGIVPQNDGGVMVYAPWIGAGLIFIAILVALFVIIRKLNKKDSAKK